MELDKYKRLFAFMSYENALVVRVSLETGMRIGDVLKLAPCDLKGRTLYFRASKTGKEGSAVISADLARRLRRVAGDRYIFPKRGKPEEYRTRQAVWKDVKRAAATLKAAGILGGENISPHSARKTFAVEDMERHGIEHTRKALQHSDKSLTRMYAFSDKMISGFSNEYLLKKVVEGFSVLCEKFEELSEKIESKL